MTYKFLDLDGLKHFLQQFVSKLKTVAFSGSYNDLSDKPSSLPANGGNAATVGGKDAATLQNYNNLTNKPSSLPANGGNADTVDGKHAADLQNYNNLSNKPTIVNNGTTTATNTVLDGRMGKTLSDQDINLQNQINSLNSSLVRVRTIENDNFDWTVIEYPANLVKMWRYVNISATAKTNTIALPNAMKDTEYAVEIAPIFNGHLLHSAWAGDLNGADGRKQTSIQISIEGTDSESNIGVILFITGYLKSA